MIVEDSAKREETRGEEERERVRVPTRHCI